VGRVVGKLKPSGNSSTNGRFRTKRKKDARNSGKDWKKERKPGKLVENPPEKIKSLLQSRTVPELKRGKKEN